MSIYLQIQFCIWRILLTICINFSLFETQTKQGISMYLLLNARIQCLAWKPITKIQSLCVKLWNKTFIVEGSMIFILIGLRDYTKGAWLSQHYVKYHSIMLNITPMKPKLAYTMALCDAKDYSFIIWKWTVEKSC